MSEFSQVTFYDSKNDKSETYELKVGAKIKIVDQDYTVGKNNQLFSDGKLVKYVNVSLPELTAISAWNCHKDNIEGVVGRIDEQDVKELDKKASYSLTAGDDNLGESINKAMESADKKLEDTEFRVQYAGGSFAGASVETDEKGNKHYSFYTFFTRPDKDLSERTAEDYKSINIEF